MFFKGSRYEQVPAADLDGPGGRKIRYKKTRFIGPATPREGEAPAEQAHIVTQGERLDLLAHQYFRDPERFWRICDANFALWPDDLVAQPGQTIAIPNAEE
jgi:hypothetical protein